ncbi:hypothetical protein Ferp_1479 [Ferroglobus placidus DSM 10642]|uniref:Uncharacterized protein n=1 Tax=Ferroglobus placidus (strain DSM 10642 / AEDII12DO) TaxID=589924 RepID=D3RYR7_FERPA|nr:hypothetical protein Ferp_1479 [Ferroglobus placidus DSM 10642]
MKCYHDLTIDCKWNLKCFECPIAKAFAEDYPH